MSLRRKRSTNRNQQRGRLQEDVKREDPIVFESSQALLDFVLLAVEGLTEAAAKHWIKKAIKHPGRCTGEALGGPDCPKGSPQYNLALRFKKGGDLYKAAEKKRQRSEGRRLPKGRSLQERWRGGRTVPTKAGEKFDVDAFLMTAEPLETYDIHIKGDAESFGRVQRVRDQNTMKIIPGGKWGAQVFDEGRTVTLKKMFSSKDEATAAVLKHFER